MTSQTYLILIRDGRLALAVGAALEDRLLRDGYRAMALVPTVRGPEFADADYQRHFGVWQAGRPRIGPGPLVVALYEDGLMTRLESLGLAAYVGVPREEEWRIVHWDNDAGAIMLPVATARDLVDAVADHAPWSKFAAGPKVTPLFRRSASRAGHGGTPTLSRKIAVASVAGPLLFVGLPSVAAASANALQAPAQRASGSGGSMAAVDTAYFQPSQTSAGSGGVPLPGGTTASGTSPGFFSWLGTQFQNAMTAYGQAEITNAQMNQAAAQAFINAIPHANEVGLSVAKVTTPAGAVIGGYGGAIAAALAASETGPGAAAAAWAGFQSGARAGGYAGGVGGYTAGFLYGLYKGMTMSPTGGNTSQPGGAAPGSTPGAGSTAQPGGSTGGGAPGGAAPGSNQSGSTGSPSGTTTPPATTPSAPGATTPPATTPPATTPSAPAATTPPATTPSAPAATTPPATTPSAPAATTPPATTPPATTPSTPAATTAPPAPAPAPAPAPSPGPISTAVPTGISVGSITPPISTPPPIPPPTITVPTIPTASVGSTTGITPSIGATTGTTASGGGIFTGGGGLSGGAGATGS